MVFCYAILLNDSAVSYENWMGILTKYVIISGNINSNEVESLKTKFMLIVSILLLVIAIIFIWKGNNNTIGTALLMIVMLLNVIRGLINVWNKRRLK